MGGYMWVERVQCVCGYMFSKLIFADEKMQTFFSFFSIFEYHNQSLRCEGICI